MKSMLTNPDGSWSLSRCAFAVSLLTVLSKVMLNGVFGTIDGGTVAALLGASGIAYAARTQQQGKNPSDPKAVK